MTEHEFYEIINEFQIKLLNNQDYFDDELTSEDLWNLYEE